MKLLAALLVGWTAAACASLVCGGRLPFIELRVAGRGRRGASERWLREAGVQATVAQCVAGVVAVFVVTYATLGVVAGPLVAIVPAAACAALPLVLAGRRRATRLAAAQRAWPDGLRDVLTAINSGQSMHQAMLSLSQCRQEPLRNAFARYPSLSRALGTVGALEAVRAELADPVSDRVLEVFMVAAERGGSIVRTILEDLTAAISADLAVLNEIDTAILESRINARAVVVLPWLALVLINQSGGPFRAFYESRAGAVVIAIGGILTLVGWSMVTRLSRIPQEQRVFSMAGRP